MRVRPTDPRGAWRPYGLGRRGTNQALPLGSRVRSPGALLLSTSGAAKTREPGDYEPLHHRRLSSILVASSPTAIFLRGTNAPRHPLSVRVHFAALIDFRPRPVRRPIRTSPTPIRARPPTKPRRSTCRPALRFNSSLPNPTFISRSTSTSTTAAASGSAKPSSIRSPPAPTANSNIRTPSRFSKTSAPMDGPARSPPSPTSWTSPSASCRCRRRSRRTP